jgi:hypothetical protein
LRLPLAQTKCSTTYRRIIFIAETIRLLREQVAGMMQPMLASNLNLFLLT